MKHVFDVLFGWPGTWGTGGNMVAWIICGAIGGTWLHAKEKARHLQKMAQSARHHAELLEQGEQLKALAERHHLETHRRLDDHARELATIKAVAPKGGARL